MSGQGTRPRPARLRQPTDSRTRPLHQLRNPGARKDSITHLSTDLPHAVDFTTLYAEILILCNIQKEKAMRIIHVTNSAQKSTAGIEKAATSLAMAQKARGSDVMLAIDSAGKFTAECQKHGISVMMHEGLGLPLTMASQEDAIRDFIECIKNFSPDIIHCHYANSALVAIAAGNRMGIPCALTSDGTRPVIESLRRGLRFAVICLTVGGFEELRNETIDMGVFRIQNGTRVVPAQARKRKLATVSYLLAVWSCQKVLMSPLWRWSNCGGGLPGTVLCLISMVTAFRGDI